MAADPLARLVWFGIALLAVWRSTHLFHAEHGPWGSLQRLRNLAERFGSELFQCFFCLSLWTSAPVALMLEQKWPSRVLVWLALSAGAILIEVKVLGGPARGEE